MIKETLLVTMDVTSLYMNLPNEDGLRAALLALERHQNGLVKHTNLSLIKLPGLILKLNYFHGNNFLPLGGTAIGTKATLGFAIVYMGMFEENSVYNYPLQPVIYLRYRDDIFYALGALEEEVNN